MVAALANLPAHVERVRVRVVQDALAEALASYWSRRAAAFRHARPRPGDYTGQATEADLAETYRRLEEIAVACDHAAQIALLHTTHDTTQEHP